MQLVVHGGAGSSPEEPTERQAVLDEAAHAGADASTPLDAVEAAIGVLEASPRFNAGRGGAVQADGVIRTDAGVMTDDRAVGAVCALPGVVRSITVARAVLERTPHGLLNGERAAGLAELAGVETGCDLLTEETRARFDEADPPGDDLVAVLDWVRDHYGADDERRDHDTVGAVAVDDEGAIAAATSTGGRWFALPGRVGDTPQVGAGFYAAPAGGASATGHGEDIARVTLSRDAIRRLDAGESPQAAAEAAIDEFEETTDAEAGLVLADHHGRVGSARNTEEMQLATARD